MSGYKESRYYIEAMRQAELRRQRERARAVTKIGSMRRQIRSVLGEAAPGLRASFHTETEQAERWLRAIVLEEQSATQLLAHAERGRRILAQVKTAYTQVANQTACQQLRQLAEFEAEVIAALELLQRWSLKPVEPTWKRRTAKLRGTIERQEYRRFPAMLERQRAQLATEIREAEDLDDKHERRRYVLKAMRQAVYDLHWVELDGPRYEEKGNLRSRILYAVDTRIRGTIQFSIGLDGIASNSSILDSHCVDEFDRLSELMAKHFGVQTKFRVPESEGLPKKMQKGKKDIPCPAREIEMARQPPNS